MGKLMQININIPIDWREYILKRLQETNKYTNELELLESLKEKGHINDVRFTQWWVENRNQRKGSSVKKLKLELQQKGINQFTIDQVVEESNRDDKQELKKIIAKKTKRYADRQKLISYLLRQGFLYGDILRELSDQ